MRILVITFIFFAFVSQNLFAQSQIDKWTEEGKKGFGLGVFASIVTEGDKVTEIRVTGGGKKKQDKERSPFALNNGNWTGLAV